MLSFFSDIFPSFSQTEYQPTLIAQLLTSTTASYHEIVFFGLPESSRRQDLFVCDRSIFLAFNSGRKCYHYTKYWFFITKEAPSFYHWVGGCWCKISVYWFLGIQKGKLSSKPRWGIGRGVADFIYRLYKTYLDLFIIIYSDQLFK